MPTVTIVNPTITAAIQEEAGPPSEFSPTENITPQNYTATRILRVTWSTAVGFVQEILGKVEDTGSNTIKYTLPQLYPHTIEGADLVATSASVRPFGKSTNAAGDTTGVVEYADQFGIVTVGYESAPDSRLRLLVEENLTPSVEFLTTPRTKLYWDAAQAVPLQTDEAPGQQVRMWEWSYKMKRMPFIPTGVLTKIGYVSTVELESQWYNLSDFATEQALYNGAEIEERTNWLGDSEYDITLSFSLRLYSWNKAYQSGETVPQVIYDDAGAVFKAYPTEDLSSLVLTLA